MKIGNVELTNPVITAPMAGISTRVYRDILRRYGAALVWGEMISAQALVYNNQRTFELLAIDGEAWPCAVQLSGSKPDVLAEAARIVAEHGADLIDLNMGCPAPKVVRNGEGARLLCDPQQCALLMQAVVSAVKIPVTAKLRLGWTDDQRTYMAAAEMLQDSGAAAITLHGRTREQFYAGTADWSPISQLKERLQIPVIGNGDVFRAEDALAMRQQCACDGIMIGRGMVGNPWLVQQCVAVLAGDPCPPPPSYEEVLTQALAHLRAQVAYEIELAKTKIASSQTASLEGELTAVRTMRGHLAWYIKGIPYSAGIRNRLNQLTQVDEIELLFANWLVQLGERPQDRL